MHAVDEISSLTGTFSAAFYNDTMIANVQYPGNIQYELRLASTQHSTVGLTKTYVMTRVDMVEMYYSKDAIAEAEKQVELFKAENLAEGWENEYAIEELILN